MKSQLLSLFLFFAQSAFGLDINLSFWSKPQRCEKTYCLPTSIANSGPHTIKDPEIGSASRLSVPFDQYTIKFTFAKRETSGGYYSFQTEIVDGEGRTIALCSRYEKLTTMERAPVGACAGVVEGSGQLFGVTVNRPDTPPSPWHTIAE